MSGGELRRVEIMGRVKARIGDRVGPGESHPFLFENYLRTVLAAKDSLRRATPRALNCSEPFGSRFIQEKG